MGTTSVIGEARSYSAESQSRPERKEGDIGLDGRDLPERLQNALRKIVYDFEQEHYSSWRYYNRKFAQADFFAKGQQSIFWDYVSDTWREPSRGDLDRVGYDQETTYHYPVNFYGALMESIVAVLIQRRPTVRWVPENFQKQADISAAKARNDAKGYIDRITNTQVKNAKVLYTAFNHGIFAGYTRWKVGEEFGTHEEPELEMAQEALPSHYYCPECGGKTPEEGLFTTAGMCRECGAPLDESGYVPESVVDVPRIRSVKQVPNGQLVTDIHDGLELRLPYYEQELKNCPLLGLVNEVHENTLKSTYPDKADVITGGYMSSAGAGGDDTDRTYRLARMEPSSYYYQFTTTASTGLVTWRRYWLRPSSYWGALKEDREELEKVFPDGCHIEFANAEFLRAYNESMDKHWALGRAKPGVGMFTPSIGQDAIPLQQAYNFDEAIKREYIEYKSFEPEFVDSNVIDFQALNRKKIRAREMIPVKIPGGRTIRDLIYEKRSGRGPEAAFRHAPDMFDKARFIVGAPPTLTGGTEKSLKPTTYTADRDLALGRKGIHWIYLTQFWSDVAEQQMDILAEHAEEDLYFQTKQQNGEMTGVTVTLADLKGGKAKVYVEMDEKFPMLIEQQREIYMTLVQSGDERFGEVLNHPKNIEYGKQMTGLTKLHIPGEDDRIKQQKEIQQLIESQPTELEGGEGEEPNLEPSIMPEREVDNHEIQAEECRDYLVSTEGMRMKEVNPMGYANVLLHLVAHQQLAIEKMQELRALSTPPPEETEEGKSSGE